MWPVSRALRKAGFATTALGYRSRDWPLDRIVETLSRRIAGIPGDRIHVVGHSMGGLVAQAVSKRLDSRRLGNIVMLAPPAQGSELVDLLRRFRLDRLAIRHAADLLAPQPAAHVAATLGDVDFPLGIIAGNRSGRLLRRMLPLPHDGRVSVAATHLVGEADHITLPVSHTAMLLNAELHRQVIAFLRSGRFDRMGSELENVGAF